MFLSLRRSPYDRYNTTGPHLRKTSPCSGKNYSMSLGHRHVVPNVYPKSHISIRSKTKVEDPTTICGEEKFGAPPRGAPRALNWSISHVLEMATYGILFRLHFLKIVLLITFSLLYSNFLIK